MFEVDGKKINNLMFSKDFLIVLYHDENKQAKTKKIEGKAYAQIVNKSFKGSMKTKLSKLFESEV